jgi:integral membrane protein
MWRTPIGKLRLLGMLEGASFVVLLFVAMPLKYVAGQPLAVRIVGMAHGVLFLMFCFALVHVRTQHDWKLMKAGKVLIAALLPFGPFVIDRSLKRDEQAASGVS